MRMLLEASRAAPHDLPPDMDFFQVPTIWSENDTQTPITTSPPPHPLIQNQTKWKVPPQTLPYTCLACHELARVHIGVIVEPISEASFC